MVIGSLSVRTNLPQYTMCQQSLNIHISDVTTIIICRRFFHEFHLFEWVIEFLIISRKQAHQMCQQRFFAEQVIISPS